MTAPIKLTGMAGMSHTSRVRTTMAKSTTLYGKVFLRALLRILSGPRHALYGAAKRFQDKWQRFYQADNAACSQRPRAPIYRI